MRTRLLALLAALLLLSPASAFAQGAGDDQYQDPFPDTPSQQDSQDGLSDEPPTTGGGGGSGGSGGGSGSAGDTGTTTPPAEADAPENPSADAAAADELPRTGSEPLWLALLGSSLLLVGYGLRLRTIDPDAF